MSIVIVDRCHGFTGGIKVACTECGAYEVHQQKVGDEFAKRHMAARHACSPVDATRHTEEGRE